MYVNSYVDWLTAGQFYTYKDVRFDKVIAQSVSPLEYYPVLNGADYIEDTNMGMRKFKMSMHDIASYFRDVLELKDLKYIEDVILNIDYESGSMNLSNSIIADRYGNAYEFFKDKYGNRGADISITDAEGLTDVYHYVFTTYTKIQILVYEDQLGKMHKKEVTADYKLNREAGDLHLEAEWVNEMWNGYRIGDEALGLYTIPQPITTQRHEVNNTANVKNPYGGKGFMYNGLMNPSIVKPLIPFQVIYNIIHYYREMAIAKNQGKILVLPKGLLIDDDQISQEEAVYYMKADGKLYVDETADGFNAAQQSIRQVDLSDSNYSADDDTAVLFHFAEGEGLTTINEASGINANFGFGGSHYPTWVLLSETVVGNTYFDSTVFNSFPNPSNGSFSIKSKDLIKTIQITDVLGKKVFSESVGSNATTVNTNLTKGIYLMQIVTSKGSGTQKIVVE
jgi:hypothetical protein